jgi:hypothetical protein
LNINKQLVGKIVEQGNILEYNTDNDYSLNQILFKINKVINVFIAKKQGIFSAKNPKFWIAQLFFCKFNLGAGRTGVPPQIRA